MTAGSINLNGTLTIEVQRPGGETVMGDIVRMVEEAQSREAPVQRLADEVTLSFYLKGRTGLVDDVVHDVEPFVPWWFRSE